MKYLAMKPLLAGVLTAGMLLGTVSVQAYEAGNLILRAGVAGVFPTGSSDSITPLASGARVEAQSAVTLGLTGTWMITDTLGIGVLASTPFEHDIEAAGTISNLGKVGDTKHLPPTLTLQYYFNPASKIHTYVGAGINYTIFFEEDTTGALAGLDLKLDNSLGLALEAGVDYELENNWLVSAQLWYIDLDTEATIETIPGSYDVNIDPWVFMMGVGRVF